MAKQPVIVIQLVHISGPMQGQIQEFLDADILIGRQASCNVRFPKDLVVVSRRHSRITREGNRFKLVDLSTNGTFLNGKAVKEAFLKSGDVLDFAEGGPKISFLTKVDDSVQPAGMPNARTSAPSVAAQERASVKSDPSSPVRPPTMETPPPTESLETTRVSFIIQFGPTLRSFTSLPIEIGKNPKCDFCLDHPQVFDLHAQVSHSQGDYWIKDLTGRGLVLVDGRPIRQETILQAGSRLSFSPRGPDFKYLGEGRLAEIEIASPEEHALPPTPEKHRVPPREDQKPDKGPGGIIRKFLKK